MDGEALRDCLEISFGLKLFRLFIKVDFDF